MADEERRKKYCYWHVPFDMSEIRLEPEGEPYKTHVDEEDGTYYIIDDDGERTYLMLG